MVSWGGMTSKRYINLPIDPVYFPELKELKFRYAAWVGRDATWGEFLKFMAERTFGEQEGEGLAAWEDVRRRPVELEGDVEYAEMRQPDQGERSLGVGEVEAEGWYQNDLTSEKLARMTMSSVFLSERSCQRIAEILFEKAKG